MALRSCVSSLAFAAFVAAFAPCTYTGPIPVEFDPFIDDPIGRELFKELRFSLGDSGQVRQARGDERRVKLIVHTLLTSRDDEIAYAVVWVAFGPAGDRCSQGCYLNSTVGRAGNLAAERAGQRIAADTLTILRPLSPSFP